MMLRHWLDLKRSSRGRAALLAAGGAMLVLQMLLDLALTPRPLGTARDALWIAELAIWLVVLVTGGGLMLDRATRSTMNDELALHNRARAYAAGFVVALATTLALLAASWLAAIDAATALRLISGASVAAALARFAQLELR